MENETNRNNDAHEDEEEKLNRLIKQARTEARARKKKAGAQLLKIVKAATCDGLPRWKIH
ncbi:MAG: hypothetical protein GY765_03105 [bacterium]|nr:hypothetical protein [bacterium]